MPDQARAVAVNVQNMGDELVVDHLSGVTVLQLTDVYDFAESGQVIMPDGAVYAYTAAGALNEEADTITIDTATVAAYDAGSRVEAYPLAPIVTATLEDGNPARVPHHLVPLLAEGQYPDGIAVTITKDDQVGSGLKIDDVPGKTPQIAGSMLDPNVPIPSTVIDDSFVYGNTVTPDQVRSQAGQINSFFTDMGLLGRLLVGDYIDIDGDASTITIYADAAHTMPLVQLNPAGSVWRGQIITNDIAVLNSILLQGVLSRITNNALLTIANGVADPTTAPSITEGWQQVAQPAIPAGYVLTGICDHPTAGYATRLLFKTADKRAYTQVINMATGAQVSLTILADVPGFTEDMFSGIAYSAGYYYVGVMNFSDPTSGFDAVYLVKFNATTNAYVAQVAAVGYTAGQDRSATCARVAVDYTTGDIFIANSTNDVVRVPASLASATSMGFTGSVPNLLGYGPFDYGANRWLAAHDSSAIVASSSSTLSALSESGSAAWGGVVGARYFWHATDARFYILSAGVLYRLAPYGADETFWAQYADTDATHTTAPSPMASLLIHARKFATLQLPPAAPSTTGADVFVGYGGSTPSNANMHKRAESLSSRVMFLSGGKVVTGANPPTVSTFSGGTPGEIVTEAGGWLLTGAGRGSADLIDHKPVYVGSKTANQAVATSTDVKLTWVDNTTHSDPDTAFITQSGGDITLKQAGWYEIYACAQWAIQGTNTRQLNFYLNGSVIAEGRQPGSTSGPISQQLKRILKVSANDVLSVHAFQDSGSSINVVGNANLPSVVSVKWMGPT